MEINELYTGIKQLIGERLYLGTLRKSAVYDPRANYVANGKYDLQFSLSWRPGTILKLHPNALRVVYGRVLFLRCLFRCGVLGHVSFVNCDALLSFPTSLICNCARSQSATVLLVIKFNFYSSWTLYFNLLNNVQRRNYPNYARKSNSSSIFVNFVSICDT